MGVLNSTKEGDLRGLTFPVLRLNRGATLGSWAAAVYIGEEEKIRLLSEVTQNRIKRGDSSM